MRILIIGAGGHAQVIADLCYCLAAAGSSCRPIGFVDDNPQLHGQQFLDLPVWGSIESIGEVGHDAVAIGIGHNATRRRFWEQLRASGEHVATLIHPAATIARNVLIGEGTVVFAGAIIETGSRIGANVILNTGCRINHHNRIDDHAHVGPGALTGGDVVLDTGAFLGIGATVHPQRVVGAWATVGAGATVIHPVAPHTVVAGVPARLLGAVAP